MKAAGEGPEGAAGFWRTLFDGAGRDPKEIELFHDLFALFSSLAMQPGFAAGHPELKGLVARCRKEALAGSADGAEAGLAAVYAYLHGAGMTYSADERKKLDDLGGYWCHAGGFAPLWRAAGMIGPDTRLGDYGAGNGLQGLLLQHLYPHRKTTLVEISGPMVAKGRLLQDALAIAPGRVAWIHGSVEAVRPSQFDFIYIYRPLRPEREAGRVFYESFAADLAASRHPVVIFSVADCLKDFIDTSFQLFHDDGQLACFRREG